MIAVIFQVFPIDYLNIAADLRPQLSDVEGFISIERFESLQTSGKILSLSFWENEQAVELWRNQMMHRKGQASGQDYIFSDYRIRVASVLRDYTLESRANAPEDSNAFFEKV